MRDSLHKRYFLATTILLLFSFVVLGGGMSLQGYNYSIKEKRDSLNNTAEQISNLTADLLTNYSARTQNTYNYLLDTMTDGGKLHVLVCSADGQVVITSDDTDRAYIGAYVSKNVMKKLVEKGYYSGVGNLGGLYKGNNYTVAVPVENTMGQHAGYVFVTTSMAFMRGLLYDILYMFLLSAALVFMLAAVFSYLTVRGMTKPIKRMSYAAKKFAQGDFSTRVQVNRSDELGELMLTFNNMADSLEKSEELRRSFVANVSHELRSPMTSIGGFVDGILDGTIPPDRQEHYLKIVSGEVGRLSRLVSRMLDITRLQAKDVSAESAWFDMCELVRRVIVGFENKLEEKELTLDVHLSSYKIDIFANEDMIYQAVYNLTENAIKFSAPGSAITVRMENKGGKLSFFIRNYGESIPADQLGCVFDRFHKTDRSRGNDREGLGLGLYIVKTIINQHKGDVGVESADGVTEFSFVLPTENKGKN